MPKICFKPQQTNPYTPACIFIASYTDLLNHTDIFGLMLWLFESTGKNGRFLFTAVVHTYLIVYTGVYFLCYDLCKLTHLGGGFFSLT